MHESDRVESRFVGARAAGLRGLPSWRPARAAAKSRPVSDLDRISALGKARMFMAPESVAVYEALRENNSSHAESIGMLCLSVTLDAGEIALCVSEDGASVVRERVGGPDEIARRLVRAFEDPELEGAMAARHYLDVAERIAMREFVRESSVGWSRAAWRLIGGSLDEEA